MLKGFCLITCASHHSYLVWLIQERPWLPSEVSGTYSGYRSIFGKLMVYPHPKNAQFLFLSPKQKQAENQVPSFKERDLEVAAPFHVNPHRASLLSYGKLNGLHFARLNINTAYMGHLCSLAFKLAQPSLCCLLGKCWHRRTFLPVPLIALCILHLNNGLSLCQVPPQG